VNVERPGSAAIEDVGILGAAKPGITCGVEGGVPGDFVDVDVGAAGTVAM
jgi:hypothetical protein